MTDDLTGETFETAPYVWETSGRKHTFRAIHHLMLFQARVLYPTVLEFVQWWSRLHPLWVKEVTPLLAEEERELVKTAPNEVAAVRAAAEAKVFAGLREVVRSLGYDLVRPAS